MQKAITLILTSILFGINSYIFPKECGKFFQGSSKEFQILEIKEFIKDDIAKYIDGLWEKYKRYGIYRVCSFWLKDKKNKNYILDVYQSKYPRATLGLFYEQKPSKNEIRVKRFRISGDNYTGIAIYRKFYIEFRGFESSPNNIDTFIKLLKELNLWQ